MMAFTANGGVWRDRAQGRISPDQGGDVPEIGRLALSAAIEGPGMEKQGSARRRYFMREV